MSLHHSFDIDLAAELSIEEAILIHHFQHWVYVNRNLKKNLIGGRTWTYQTLDFITLHFPYLSKKQIERVINKLVEKGILLKDNFNNNAYDRTIWYSFFDEEKFVPIIEKSRNREMEKTVSGNENPEIGTPIPDTKTYTKTKEEHPPNPPEGGGVREACGAFVKLTKKDREALEEAYGVQRVQEIIDEINDYLASTGKKPYKDYAAAVRQWARRRGYVKTEKPEENILEGFEEKKPEKRIVTKQEADREWFDRLESAKNLCESGKFQEFKIASTLMNRGHIWVESNCVDFLRIPESKYYYGEPGFREKIYSVLRKMNIVVKS